MTNFGFYDRILLPLVEGIFLYPFLREANIYPVKWRCRHESKNYTRLHRVQAAQLQHNEKQEEYPGQDGDEQVLQILQEAYAPPRN